MSKCIAHTTKPAEALPFRFRHANRSRLCSHVSDFQILQSHDFLSVLTEMRQSPESPVSIELTPPFAFHQRKQNGDLCPPYRFTRVLACLHHSPQGNTRQPFGQYQIRAGEFGDQCASEHAMRVRMPGASADPLHERTRIKRSHELPPQAPPQPFVLVARFCTRRIHHDAKSRHVRELGKSPGMIRPCLCRGTLAHCVDP